jgi:hypothetical protein
MQAESVFEARFVCGESGLIGVRRPHCVKRRRMSIQAVAWALEQDFSYTTPKGRQTSAHGAKLVLISLANHADHTSGHCWPSAPTIAKESSCSVRSVYRLVAALERNGFIDVKRVKGSDNKQRSNNYWIRFDRPPAPWQFFPDDEKEDDDGDTVSRDSEGEQNEETGLENATVSPGRHAIGVTRQESLEPSIIEPSAEPPPTVSRVNLNLPWPKEFVANARAEQKARLDAAEEARKPERIPVIEGSKPWDSWVKRGHDPTLTCTVEVNGKRHRGWYFPTLYPQPRQSTGPPISPLMNPEDEKVKL